MECRVNDRVLYRAMRTADLEDIAARMRASLRDPVMLLEHNERARTDTQTRLNIINDILEERRQR